MSREPMKGFPPPGEKTRSESGDGKRVYDPIAGPNVKPIDSVIQFAAIVVGTMIGVGGGAVYAHVYQSRPSDGMILGGVAGLLLSLFVSGFVIGLVRGILVMHDIQAAGHAFSLRKALPWAISVLVSSVAIWLARPYLPPNINANLPVLLMFWCLVTGLIRSILAGIR